MKGNEKEEDKLFRNTIGFEKPVNNKLPLIKNDSIENRARSFVTSNKKLLQKYIPKLKPIEADLNPSPIFLSYYIKKNILIHLHYLLKSQNFNKSLKGNNETKLVNDNFKIIAKNTQNKKYMHKLRSVAIEEEVNQKAVISNDEECNKMPNVSDSSDNESKDNQRKSNKINLKTKKENIIIENKVQYCINTTRRKLDKIKNKIINKKYKDDTHLDFIHEKNLNENCRIRCIQNYIEQLKIEKKEEYEKYKNKTISFKDMKLFKPPILEFLEKNEISNNSTLSSL